MKKIVMGVCLLLLTLLFQSRGIAAPFQGDSQKAVPQTADVPEARQLSVQVVTLYKQGKYDEALPLAKRAVELRTKALGWEHTLVADALVNLASIYVGKKKYSDAESSFQQALAIFEKAYGAESPKLCGLLDNLGWLAFGNGYYEKAESLLQRSLAINEKNFGEGSKETTQSLIYLGRINQRLRRYPRAITFYKRALELREKAGNTDNKELADLAQKCSCALSLNNQDKEAGEYAKRAQTLLMPVDGKTPNAVKRPSAVLAGTAIKREEPAYPEEAKRSRITGKVIVEVTVDETGKVIQTRVLCGDEVLGYAAEQAARKWLFTPTLLSGLPVKVIGTITFNFSL